MPIRQRINIRRRNFAGSARESELPLVPHGYQGQHNLGRGKGQYFHHVSEEGKEGRLRKRYNSYRLGFYQIILFLVII
jgi:hypothetical protein